MRTVLLAVILVLGLSMAAFAQDGEHDLLASQREALRQADLPKYALVLGIENYDHLPNVTNAKDDAGAVSNALNKLGFAVDTATDLNRQEFFARLNEFVNRSLGHSEPETAVVLFYFAGHGFRGRSGNNLVPADTVDDVSELLHKSIPLSHIVEKITGSNVALALVFIDACRTELSSSTLGQERVGFAETPPEDLQSVYYGFASSLGQPSLSFVRPDDANSPFSSALARRLGTADKELHDMFEGVKRDVYIATSTRQIPMEQKKFLGEYYVSPSDKYSANLEARLALALIMGPVCVQEYIVDYPAGPYTTGARSWLLLHGESAVGGTNRCPH